MSRKKTIYAPGISYHVVSRCIELKDYLKTDVMKDMMEDVLLRTRKKYKFHFNGYVIMPNHIHLYIRTLENEAPLFRIVQYIKSRFAEAFNRKMNRKGHFWNERYKCKITEESKKPVEYSINTHNYVGYNPVKKGLVNDPRDYKYSSYRYYVEVGYQGRVPIDFHPDYLALGKTPQERVDAFLAFERDYRRKLRI